MRCEGERAACGLYLDAAVTRSRGGAGSAAAKPDGERVARLAHFELQVPAVCKLDSSEPRAKIVCGDTVMQWVEKPAATLDRAKWNAYAAGGSLQRGERVFRCRFGKQRTACREIDLVADEPHVHSIIAMAIFGDVAVTLSCGYPGKRRRKPPDLCASMLEYE